MSRAPEGAASTSGAQTIPGLIRIWADATPGSPALVAPGGKAVSFARLSDLIGSAARQLRAAGIGRADRIAVVHPNGPELAAAFLGIASAATCAPLNPAYRLSELEFYLADLGARAVAVPAGQDTPVRMLARRRGIRLLEIEPLEAGSRRVFAGGEGRRRRTRAADPEDVALVLHTSGTTARPKIVPLTHRQLALSARNIAETLELTAEDRCLNVMPLFHIHGLVGALLATLSSGGAVICTSGFRVPSFRRWLDELGPTWYTAVPTMHQAVLERLASTGPVPSTLRFVRSSSATLPAHVCDALEETFGVPAIEAYGMTEAAHQMTSNPLPPGRRKRGSVGVAGHIEVAVLGDEGHRLPVGQVGEVVIRGETVIPAYESNPEANAAAFVDGWFRTGDEGWFDEDGYLFLKGRSKEIINRGGEKVSPAEVEDVLLTHADVVQAVSFAVPHARLGEGVGAAVVARPGSRVSERDLQAHVAGRLADFKVPSTVVLVDDIPKGPTGKLQRIGMAERLGIAESSAEQPPAAYTEPRTALQRELAELWSEVLEVERVGLDDDFFALGGDSILGADLVARIAARLERRVPLTTLMWAPTLGAFAALVEAGEWDDTSRVVPVQREGSRLPLFVVHGLHEEVLSIAVLKRTLGSEQPLYALRAVPERLGYESIEALAEDYLDDIRRVQPHGPYLFASMCSGSAIVIELARCARSRGEDVAFVAVIDPRTDLDPGAVRHYARQAQKYAREGRLLWAIRRKLRHWLSRLAPAMVPDDQAEADPLGPALASLRRGYRLRPFHAPFTVISTMDYAVPRSVWERYADRVAWYDVDAPHHTIFQHPHADLLGETLVAAMRDAGVAGETP